MANVVYMERFGYHMGAIPQIFPPQTLDLKLAQIVERSKTTT
jgi:hypothetical protein